jgi:hypothetical protein
MAEANGQATTAPETTTQGSQTSPAAPESQSAPAQTSVTAPVAEETFFDPESIKGKPELEAAYRQMQGEFTRRTTALKQSENKVKAYDAFSANPTQAMQELASQFGYTLTKAQAQAIVNDQNQEPKSWDDVYKTAEDRVRASVLKELQPFLKQVTETRQSQVEKTLDEKCPDWRVYESKMQEMLAKHPTLANDPEELYRVSVPPNVLQARAMQSALQKLQDKASSSQLSAGSSTTQQPNRPKGKLTFSESVEYAKAQLKATH